MHANQKNFVTKNSASKKYSGNERGDRQCKWRSHCLGSSVGATGARLVLTALKELKLRRQKTALATFCVGGGQGGALWLERN